MRFATQYDERKRIPACAGDRMKKTYTAEYDKKGAWHLVETGEESLYEEIQSHADATNLNVIMRRYQNGEADVLKRIEGFYGDVSDMPTNLADMLNASMKAQQMFDGLTPDIKERFGQNYVEFMQTAGSKEWYEKLGLLETKAPEPAVADQKGEATE